MTTRRGMFTLTITGVGELEVVERRGRGLLDDLAEFAGVRLYDARMVELADTGRVVNLAAEPDDEPT